MEVKRMSCNDFDSENPKLNIESPSTEELWKDAIERHQLRKRDLQKHLRSYWNQLKQIKQKHRILLIGVAIITKINGILFLII